MAGMTTGGGPGGRGGLGGPSGLGGPGGSGGVPRPGDEGDHDRVAEELLPDEVPEEGEPIGEDALASLPDEADVADVVEQHTEVAADDDDLDRVSEDLEA